MKTSMIKSSRVFLLMIGFGACCCMSPSLANNEGVSLAEKMALKMPFPQTPQTSNWALSLSTGWTSDYISEGFNNAPGTSLWETTTAVSWNNFNFTAWHALGVDQRYEEVDLVLSHDFELGKWKITPWYEHQIYISPKDDIPNPAITITYAINDWLTAGADFQWKILNRNWEGYYDVFLQSEWEITEKWSITPLVRFGYNDGYNVMANRGANCIDYSLKANYAFNERITASVFALYSEAATVLRKAELGDEFTYGISFSITF